MDEASNRGNGNQNSIPTTPIPYRGGDQDGFSTGSLEGYEQIDLGTLFESQSFEQALKSEGESAAQPAARHTTTSRESEKVTAKPRLAKPLSAYNLFFKSIKGEIEQEMKGKVGFDQLGKLVGARWKKLSKEERSVFENQADEDVIRYRTQMMEQEKQERRKREAERQEEQQRKIRSRPEAHNHPDQLQGHVARRRPPIMVRVGKIPPPPATGRHMGPAPLYLGLDQGETICLHDHRGQTRMFEVRYECFCMKRADLDPYLAQLSENTDHFVHPSWL